jgi:hypothetical protein
MRQAAALCAPLLLLSFSAQAWKEGDDCRTHPYAAALPDGDPVDGFVLTTRTCGPTTVRYDYQRGKESVNLSVLGRSVVPLPYAMLAQLEQQSLQLNLNVANGTYQNYVHVVTQAQANPELAAVYGGPDYLPVIMAKVYGTDGIAVPVPPRSEPTATQERHSTQWTIKGQYLFTYGLSTQQRAQGQSTALRVLGPFVTRMNFGALP